MRYFFLILALLYSSAQAGTIYRCKVEGKIVYAASCSSGGQQVKVWHGPGADDVLDARRQVTREKKTLSKLEKQQRKQEVREENARRIRARKIAKKNKTCARLAQRMKWAQEDASRASYKSEARTRSKARRATEKYELECGA